MGCDRLTKDQLAEIKMFQMSEVQELPAFNGRRSFLTLRGGASGVTEWRRINRLRLRLFRFRKCWNRLHWVFGGVFFPYGDASSTGLTDGAWRVRETSLSYEECSA